VQVAGITNTVRAMLGKILELVFLRAALLAVFWHSHYQMKRRFGGHLNGGK